MRETYFVLAPIFLPILAGFLLLCLPIWKERKYILAYSGICLVGTSILVIVTILQGDIGITLFQLTSSLPIYFHVDGIGRLFSLVVTIIWLLSGFFSFEYMKHEKNEKRYFGFYLITFGVLLGIDYAGNLITFYMFYELMTLMSVPLVIHTLTKEAKMAGLKYMFYSFCGAYMVLFGFFFLNTYCSNLTFSTTSALNATLIGNNQGIVLLAVFMMILGFGVKAGMFPLHAWLPTAHPVAPAPASAALSSIIVKSGVLGIIRVIFYLVGPEFIRNTWVQYTWLTLTLITVFMGSMLAYREKILKKRLAYSTVSQVSYILFGLALLSPVGFTGSLLHVIFHAFIKCTLFLVAGAIIYRTGKTNVNELTGIGKKMPITIWCYTIASLGLIGIPPTSGFISKWYLAMGSLDTKIPIFSWLGPVVLLVSALLTAGYLLPITIKGFFPGDDYSYEKLEKKEPTMWMTVPLTILTVFTVWFGMFPNQITGYIMQIAANFK